MDAQAIIDILIEALREEFDRCLCLFQDSVKNKCIDEKKFEKVPFHPEIISLYLYSIDEKCDNESIADLIDKINNKSTLPCVLFQTVRNGNMSFNEELLNKSIDCLDTINKLLNKIEGKR